MDVCRLDAEAAAMALALLLLALAIAGSCAASRLSLCMGTDAAMCKQADLRTCCYALSCRLQPSRVSRKAARDAQQTVKRAAHLGSGNRSS